MRFASAVAKRTASQTRGLGEKRKRKRQEKATGTLNSIPYGRHSLCQQKWRCKEEEAGVPCPSSGTFLPQHTWDPRHSQNGRSCARRCLGRKRLCLIHYVCLCVSFVSAEHLNIISIGPTWFVSNVKTAHVTSSPVVSQPVASKRLA